MTHLALLTVRNEAAFLLEWLAHHRAVGFDDFLVFSNDCDDGTDAMLDRLAALGCVNHVRNDGPYDKGGIQFTALKAAAKMDQVGKAGWILPLDIDEFVNIHAGDGTLEALHTALPEATAITLTWRLFGNNGQVRYLDQPVTDTFPMAAPEVLHWPWRASMFKTLYAMMGRTANPACTARAMQMTASLPRPDGMTAMGAHCPSNSKPVACFPTLGSRITVWRSLTITLLAPWKATF